MPAGPSARRPREHQLEQAAFAQPFVEHAQRADVFVTLGTSLGVYPVAALPEIAVRRGASLVVCNAEPTPFDTLASVRSDLPLGTLLPAVADRFGIPDPNSRI